MKHRDVVSVQPVNVATFYAVQWDGKNPDNNHPVQWMAGEFGWRVLGVFPKTVRGRDRRGLIIVGRNRKQYTALKGDWIVALGANGSIRICSDRQFKSDYKEIGK